MNFDANATFQVFIDGKQAGNTGKWKHTPLTITSMWDAGSDQEKFEVLATIRKTYNPDSKINIRGGESQTPSQIGRSEGFKELRYNRTTSPTASIVIVPPVMQYLRLVPQPKIENSSAVSLRA
jgi:hypothetical protein